MRRRTRRNAPLSAAEVSALKSILGSHGQACNPRRGRRGRRVRRYGKAKRVIRRHRRAANLRPHRLFAEEWSKIRTIRAAHTARRRAAMAALNSGAAAEAGASKTNPPSLLRRWVTDAEWRMTKHGRAAASVPVNIGDSVLGSHYRANPKRIVRRGGRRYAIITNKRGRKVAQFKIGRTRRHRVPSQLRRFLFKAGTARTARMQVKARRGWRAWRLRQLAKHRRAGKAKRHVRKARRVVRRHVRRAHKARRHVRRSHKRYVFTRARRLALKKAQRASRRARR
jgi:hypothetical protein